MTEEQAYRAELARTPRAFDGLGVDEIGAELDTTRWERKRAGSVVMLEDKVRNADPQCHSKLSNAQCAIRNADPQQSLTASCRIRNTRIAVRIRGHEKMSVTPVSHSTRRGLSIRKRSMRSANRNLHECVW